MCLIKRGVAACAAGTHIRGNALNAASLGLSKPLSKKHLDEPIESPSHHYKKAAHLVQIAVPDGGGDRNPGGACLK